MKLLRLFHNIRFYVLLFSLVLSIIVYLYDWSQYSGTDLFLIKLSEGYGLIALAYLYITLLASPFTQAFSYFPFKGKYIQARRATGVSVFYFAILHSLAGFFGPLGGFNGIGFLHDNFLWAVILGGIALVILTYMTLTSFDKVVEKMGFPAWKMLHRTIYLGGILILIHALLIGSQFMDLSSAIPQVSFYALFFLLVLESIRFDKYLYTQYLHEQSQRVTLKKTNLTAPVLPPTRFAVATQTTPSIPEFEFSFVAPKKVSVNQLTQLEFQPSAGSRSMFSNISPQKITFQVIMIDQVLETFIYLDPVITNQSITINAQFPHEGRFHIYLTALIPGKRHQVAHFTLDVGEHPVMANPTQVVDQSAIKHFDGMQVRLLQYPNGGNIISPESSLVVEICPAEGQLHQLQLEPISGKYGRGMMVNQQTFQYTPLLTVKDGVFISPRQIKLNFQVPSEFEPLKSGIYRIFIQFRTSKLHTIDFTIKI